MQTLPNVLTAFLLQKMNGVSVLAGRETVAHRIEQKGESKMRWTAKGPKDITLEGSREEIKQLEAMLLGTVWLKQTNNVLESSTAFLPVPPPMEDPAVCDQWPQKPGKHKPSEVCKNKEKGRFAKDSRSIYVHSICGYAGRSVYKYRAELLESAGFECMRSRRGADGLFWECWYLPGARAAKGPIKDQTSDQIVSWLCWSIGPGVVELQGERWGLGVD